MIGFETEKYRLMAKISEARERDQQEMHDLSAMRDERNSIYPFSKSMDTASVETVLIEEKPESVTEL